MKIIVATTLRPFRHAGDGQDLVAGLVDACRRRGHDVDALVLPFDPEPRHVAAQLVGLRLLDLSGLSDLVISVRAPSHLVRHPRRIVWFAGHQRGAYELWGTPWSGLADDGDGRALRDVIRAADTEALGDACRVIASSRAVARRLLRFNGITAPVIRIPVAADIAVAAAPTPYGDAVYAAASDDDAARQLLAVEAMRFVRTEVKLDVVGADLSRAERLVEAHGLANRVRLVEQPASVEAAREQIAQSLAVVHAPYDADVYGDVTTRAFAAARAVVTTYDSGAVREAVRHNATGIVCRPTPRALARAFDRLYRHRELTRRLGEAGRERLRRDLVESWDSAVEQLLA